MIADGRRAVSLESGELVKSVLTCWLVLLGGVSVQGREQVSQLGPVKVTTSLTPDAPVIGDEIVFELRVEAASEVEVLMPEFGEALDRYAILDFVPKRTIESDGSEVHLQRYTLQPNLSGAQSIPPILVEFVDNRPGQQKAPDDYDAYEILTERMDFTVESVVPDAASAELKPPLGELQPPREITTTGWVMIVLCTLGGVGGAIVAVIAYRRWQHRKLQKTAYEIAIQWLDYLLAKPMPQSDEEIDAFYVAVSRIVRTYLENRFDLRAPDLTTEEFLELAGTSSDLSRDHQGLLRDFLRQADLVKFAGVKASAEDVRSAGSLARQFLDETREHAPVIEMGHDVEDAAVA